MLSLEQQSHNSKPCDIMGQQEQFHSREPLDLVEWGVAEL